MIKQQSVIFKGNKVKGAAEVRETQKATAQLDEMVKRSARVILKIKAVFPFNLFPDEVILDESKITIYSKMFFMSQQTVSIMYPDVFNVIVEDSVFFATLEIADRFFSREPIKIKYLKRGDAQKARKIILGMSILTKENVNIQSLPINELLEKVERIGEAE